MTSPKPPARPHPPTGVAAGPRVVIVAIAGGSGAGKSWLAAELTRRLRPHAGVLALDDFYRDLSALPASRRDRINFDTPDAVDWELFDACLDRIRSGRPVAIPRYDFSTHARRPTPRRWVTRRVVLVEGLWPWVRRAQQRHYALRVFVEGPPDLRLSRRLTRDASERGRNPTDIRRQWREQVEPMFATHVEPQASDADAVLGPEPDKSQVEALALLIRRLADLPPPSPRSRNPSGSQTA